MKFALGGARARRRIAIPQYVVIHGIRCLVACSGEVWSVQLRTFVGSWLINYRRAANEDMCEQEHHNTGRAQADNVGSQQ